MSGENRNNRRPPYALYFFLLSMAVCVSSVWAIIVETKTLRPWKSVQRQYYSLLETEQDVRYQETLEQFESDAVQSRIRELQEELDSANEIFRSRNVQQEYRRLEKSIRSVQKGIDNNRTLERNARGRFREMEYLFNRFDREEARLSMESLERDAESAAGKLADLRAEELILQEELRSYTAEIDDLTLEIESLQSQLADDLERKRRIGTLQPGIRQIYLEDADRVDRCQSCHLGIDEIQTVSEEQPFSGHPGRALYLGKHPVEEFGCTFCHRGQGRATSSVEKAHGHEEFWEEPLLAGTLAQASCQMCHGDMTGLSGGETGQHGMELIEELGCFGCHKIAGFENVRRVGPELTDVGLKNNFTWMVNWLLDPGETLDSARMPTFNLNRQEAESIVDYLSSVSRSTRFDHANDDIDWDLADKGKVVWGQARCTLCHATEGVGGAFEGLNAPDLGKIGSKVNREWLFNWIKDPSIDFPDTRMPRFRFSDEDIHAVVEYLVSEYIDWDFEPEYSEPVMITVESIQKGKDLVRDFGCFGCHNIKGMEEMEQVGPFLRQEEVSYLSRKEVDSTIGDELSSIGSKPMERFDFGTMEESLQHNRIRYLQQKLKEPGSFRSGLLMPNFRLTDDEIDALTVVLAGFTDFEVPARLKVPFQPAEYKPAGSFKSIVDDVKCLSCHVINGVGETFAPDLSIEGSKVQAEWLGEFLARPDIIRPMLKQMPKFNLDYEQHMIQGNLTLVEIETIIQYFKTVLVSSDIPDTLPDIGLPPAEQVESGSELYEQKGCRACHQIGIDGGAVGPNLTSVGNRLTPGYIYVHLGDPQAVIPGIVEPDYGLTIEERVCLTSFLMSLRGG